MSAQRRCPCCQRFITARRDEHTEPVCLRCEIFECASCLQMRPFAEGCADDKPEMCDDCYATA